MSELEREVRCAIYTRKSTEEGLAQEFNTLQAQREAAEAYILSQKQNGWHTLAQRYEDGGFSGASLALGRIADQNGTHIMRTREQSAAVWAVKSAGK